MAALLQSIQYNLADQVAGVPFLVSRDGIPRAVLGSASYSSKSSYSSSYSSSKKSYKTYDSYDDGYDAIYDDDDYDEDRYDSDPDYAAGVDDAMDELDW